MLGMPGLAQLPALDLQSLPLSSIARDRVYLDDPHADKVTLSGHQPDPALTYQYLAKSTGQHSTTRHGLTGENNQQNKRAEDIQADPELLSKLMQQVLDSKTGIDRKKLEDIEEKIAALTSKEGELSNAEQAQLELLQQQREALIKEAAEKLARAKS